MIDGVISRRGESLLLCPTDIQPSHHDFEVVGVFNPGAIRVGGEMVLLARVAEKPRERRPGLVGLPRWSAEENYEVDWFPQDDVHPVDARVVHIRSRNCLRLTSVSHLRLFRKRDECDIWIEGPTVLPHSGSCGSSMEEFGIEDPRITQIGTTFWITYVAVSRAGAATALASSEDMMTFQRHGVIFCAENKDVVLFPQPIDGEYYALHRPNPRSHFSPPQIWTARSPDLVHWGKHACLHAGNAQWESDRIGAGTPPILTSEGWLYLYHGSQRTEEPGQVGQYTAGAALLDREDPTRILARSHTPIMRPTADFETDGFVPNVVFPTAMIANGETFSVYYGAADTCAAVVEFAKQDILGALNYTEPSDANGSL